MFRRVLSGLGCSVALLCACDYDSGDLPALVQDQEPCRTEDEVAWCEPIGECRFDDEDRGLNVCLKDCRFDNQCSDGASCVDGICLLACENDEACPEEMVCWQQQCWWTAATDTDGESAT